MIIKLPINPIIPKSVILYQYPESVKEVTRSPIRNLSLAYQYLLHALLNKNPISIPEREVVINISIRSYRLLDPRARMRNVCFIMDALKHTVLKSKKVVALHIDSLIDDHDMGIVIDIKRSKQ
jgi:hypothetical protein